MRLVAQVVAGLAVNAVALLVAALALDRFAISVLAFPVVVVVFTAVGAIARPVVGALVEKHAAAVSSLVGLAVAFVTLLVTDLATDRLEIEGVGTWVVASLIVWLGRIAVDLAIADRLAAALLSRRSPRA